VIKGPELEIGASRRLNSKAVISCLLADILYSRAACYWRFCSRLTGFLPKDFREGTQADADRSIIQTTSGPTRS
jgi:hypothetical protein